MQAQFSIEYMYTLGIPYPRRSFLCLEHETKSYGAADLLKHHICLIGASYLPHECSAPNDPYQMPLASSNLLFHSMLCKRVAFYVLPVRLTPKVK